MSLFRKVMIDIKINMLLISIIFQFFILNKMLVASSINSKQLTKKCCFDYIRDKNYPFVENFKNFSELNFKKCNNLINKYFLVTLAVIDKGIRKKFKTK